MLNWSARPIRSAMTWVELVIVMALIGTLAGLLLMAVQRARAAALQAQCQNHLRQIGLSLHQYHDARGRLPMGCLEWRGLPSAIDRRQLAWSAFLLPFLEQQVIFDQLDFNQPFDGPQNSVVGESRVAVYECPSSPGPHSMRGRTDYGGLFGELLVDPRQDDGVFLHDRGIRFSEITDGLTQTMAVGEDLGGPDNQWINGRNIFVQAHGINDPAAWAFDNEIRSVHSGGAMVLFCDGTPRFLSNETDRQVLGRMITRDRGDLHQGAP